MKKITYSIVLLWSVLFCSCQKEDTLTTVPEGGVQLNFSGAQANLSAEELSNIVETFHVLIYDETGNFVRHSEYENLKSVSPVKLPIGQYTFAYLSNIKSDLISGIQEDKKLEDITLSLEESEGNVLSAGSIFKGIDTLTVGKDNKSNAALQRLVGRMDIELKGIGNDVTVKSVALTGSPKKIRFNGEAEGESVKLNIPMAKKQDGVYVGQAITFPTTDSVASLEFVLESNEGVKTFDIPLKNKVEANKIHTIHATSNLTGGIWNITFDMETTPWGATISEDVTANEMLLLDTVHLHLTFADQMNVGSIRNIHLSIKNKKTDQTVYFHSPRCSSDKDTLLITQSFFGREKLSDGEYTITDFVCLDSLGMRLYDIRMCNPQTLIIDENGTARLHLPALPTVSETDRQAMFDLRDALPADNDYALQWKRAGQKISLWEGVTLNEEGRVVGIGYDELKYLGNYATKAIAGTMSDTTTPDEELGVSWSLPESFKQLTALKIFNFDDNPLTEIPAFLKDMTTLEQLSISCTAENTLPVFPANLRYLLVYSNTTVFPAHIADLTQLEYIGFAGFNKKGITIETDFTKLSNLRVLELEAEMNINNNTFPASLWNCSQLNELTLIGFNNLQFPSSLNLSSLTKLGICNTDLQPVQIEPIRNLSLTSLGISSPVFSKNGFPDWIGTMTTITDLSLENCGLTTVPASLDGLINLTSLNLWGNPDLNGKLPEKLLEKYNNNSLRVDIESDSDFVPDGILLKITPGYISTFSAAGDTCRLTVESNTDWVVEISEGDSEYIHFSRTTGNGNATVILTVDANQGIEEYNNSRYFNFSFIAGSHRRDFYVYQPYEQVILKPVWWNQLGERYLGEYSAIKYRLIIEITGRTEFNTTEEIIEAAKTLKNYLAENPVYDENGQLITVPYAG